MRSTIARLFQQPVRTSFGYRGGAIFLFSADELAEAAAHNPFEPARLEHEQYCHLMFLSAKPDADRQRALLALQGEEYRFAFHDSVLYYAYPREFAGRRRGIDFEKVLGVIGTGRTWKVVDQLIRLASA